MLVCTNITKMNLHPVNWFSLSLFLCNSTLEVLGLTYAINGDNICIAIWSDIHTCDGVQVYRLVRK